MDRERVEAVVQGPLQLPAIGTHLLEGPGPPAGCEPQVHTLLDHLA